MCKIIDSIIDWNVERGLTDFNLFAEAQMLNEELAELLDANNEDDMVDALCDLVILSIGAIYKLGYNPSEAMLETLKEIHSRKGKFNPETGKWEKDDSKEAKKYWYKAQYNECKRLPST